MPNLYKTQELNRYSSEDIKFNTVTWSTTESSVEFNPDDSIDLGTINVSAADSTSAEYAINVVSAGELLHNLKMSIMCSIPGITWIARTTDALTEALAAAGAAPATPYTTTPGLLPDGTNLTVTAGSSYRFVFQAQGSKAKIGANGFDTASDHLGVPAQLLVYWEDDDYRERMDTNHYRKPADVYKNTRQGEMFYVGESGHTLVSLGDISEVTTSRGTEVESYEKGNPKRILLKELSRAEYTVSGSMETEDFAIMRDFMGWTISDDTNSGMYMLTVNDTSSIPEKEFRYVTYTAARWAKWFKIPKGQIIPDGDILTTAVDSPFNFMLYALEGSLAPFYEYMSNGPANLIAIDIAFDIDTV
jgi:hypothetical protein